MVQNLNWTHVGCGVIGSFASWVPQIIIELVESLGLSLLSNRPWDFSIFHRLFSFQVRTSNPSVIWVDSWSGPSTFASRGRRLYSSSVWKSRHQFTSFLRPWTNKQVKTVVEMVVSRYFFNMCTYIGKLSVIITIYGWSTISRAVDSRHYNNYLWHLWIAPKNFLRDDIATQCYWVDK